MDEVNKYGKDNVNRYTEESVGTATNQNGYGGMAYYSSETCGYNGTSWDYSGCTTYYAQSEVKYAVDAWAKDKLKTSDLNVDETGDSARLSTYKEFLNLGYDVNKTSAGSGTGLLLTENVPDWIYNSKYKYWTMSPYGDCISCVLAVDEDGRLGVNGVGIQNVRNVVRPVVTLYKSAL